MPKNLATVKESVIEQALRERIEALGGVCLKVTVIGRRGFFDRLIVLPGGRIIFCELKRPKGGALRPHQRLYQERFKALGIVDVHLIKSEMDIDAMLSA